MILKVSAPAIDNRTERLRVDAVHIGEGNRVAIGDKLIEFTAGLDFAGMHDCPPTTSYRMTSSETAWVRKVHVGNGDRVETGSILALLSTEPDEPLDGAEERTARFVLAAIFKTAAW